MIKDYEIESATLGDFFSNKTKIVFHIPNYQRNYSWKKPQVQEFFTDVYEQIGSNSQHYFGMIMTLKSSKGFNINTFELIDGQQRIITSIIFLVCIRDIFYELDSKMAEDINSEIFNDVTQNSKQCYKVMHDNWDGSFFRKMLDDLPKINNEFFYNIREKIPQNIYNSFYKNGKMPKKQYSKFSKLEKHPEADELLRNAYMTIRDEITEKIIEQLNDPKINRNLKTLNDYKKLVIEFLCKLHSTLIKNSFISNIAVNDESKVYSIFNGINNRGLKLTMSETVKNWIFYHMYKENLNAGIIANNDVNQLWKDMEKLATKKELDNYIHHYLITYHSKINGKFHHIKKRESFSIIKNILNKNHKSQTNQKAKNLLIEIHEKFKKYYLLIEPDSIYTMLNDPKRISPINEEAANNIYWLNKLQSITIYPVLMAGLEQYDKKEDFAKLTRMILTWFFINRTVNKREAPQLERELAEITYNIMNQNSHKEFNIDDIQKELLKKTDMDKFFKQIPTMELSDTSSTYFLTILEYGEPQKVDANTLEHIMPKKPKKIQTLPNGETMTWLQYIQKVNPKNIPPEEIHAKYKNRLGNLTLLESDLNKLLKNELFATKLSGVVNKNNEIRSYNDSHIRLTLKICEKPKKDWTIERIEARQKDFAEQAKKLWKIE